MSELFKTVYKYTISNCCEYPVINSICTNCNNECTTRNVPEILFGFHDADGSIHYHPIDQAPIEKRHSVDHWNYNTSAGFIVLYDTDKSIWLTANEFKVATRSLWIPKNESDIETDNYDRIENTSAKSENNFRWQTFIHQLCDWYISEILIDHLLKNKS